MPSGLKLRSPSPWPSCLRVPPRPYGSLSLPPHLSREFGNWVSVITKYQFPALSPDPELWLLATSPLFLDHLDTCTGNSEHGFSCFQSQEKVSLTRMVRLIPALCVRTRPTHMIFPLTQWFSYIFRTTLFHAWDLHGINHNHSFSKTEKIGSSTTGVLVSDPGDIFEWQWGQDYSKILFVERVIS